jgi:glutamate racemase
MMIRSMNVRSNAKAHPHVPEINAISATQRDPRARPIGVSGVASFASEMAEELLRRHCKLLVIACNADTAGAPT